MPTPEATAGFATALGRVLLPGDTLLLEGGIGAGKTHFARALIQSVMTDPEDVPSPTFTLVQTYDTPRGEVWHSDLYRLTDASEVLELGLDDAMGTAICLIEWPDRLGPDQPGDALHLGFEPRTDQARRLSLTWTSGEWGTRLVPFACRASS